MKAAAIWHAAVGRVEQQMFVLDQQPDSVMVEENLRQVGIDLTKIVRVSVRTPDMPRHAWLPRATERLVERIGLTLRADSLLDTVILVYGDSDATVAGAVAGQRLGIDVAHVEAGLRSGDRTMPEEGNRIIVDMLSAWHFATEPSAMRNLLLEGRRGEFVGNTMAQTLLRMVESTKLTRPPITGNYVLVTLHRPGNVDDPASLQRMLAAIGNLHSHVHAVWVLHPRTKDLLAKINVRPYEKIMMIDPMPYGEFVQYMRFATAVVTDSGGVQEETTVLGVPCITLRSTTERPITVTDGTNRLVPLRDPTDVTMLATVVRGIVQRKIDNGKPERKPLPVYWDDRVGERIIDSLLGWEPQWSNDANTGNG